MNTYYTDPDLMPTLAEVWDTPVTCGGPIEGLAPHIMPIPDPFLVGEVVAPF